MPSTLTAQDIAQHIARGDLDDALGAIYDAMQSRFSEGAVGLTWSITLPDLGLTVTEDDLTIVEAELIEAMAGCSWANIDPVRSARDCRSVLEVCLSQRQNMSADDAHKAIGSLRVTDFLRAVKREVVSPAPLDSGV